MSWNYLLKMILYKVVRKQVIESKINKILDYLIP